jgi:hypothetical protein
MLDGMTAALELFWQARSSFTARKWRLYACACARRLPESGRQPLRGAIELAERHADGFATDHELASLRFGARHTPSSPAALLCWAPDADGWEVVRRLVHWILGAAGGSSPWEKHAAYLDLLSELLGPRPALTPPAPTLLAWEGGLVKKLAAGAYDDRAWDRLPILGDALEEAGCADEAVLAHCRGQAPHARGCWVVDHILGQR